MDDGGYSFAEYFISAAGGESAETGQIHRRPANLADLEIPSSLIRLAKRIKAIRESRAALLEPSLFGEPAWNILLALYVAAGERYALSISALCAESGAPATTATRAINRLLDLHMVRRVPNPSDNRSAYIELTGQTAAKLTELLENARDKYLAD